ncbi:MAG TPA: substrate-binding domain-containing protein [Capsulimonadaceae bacterium]|jgi:DNA-binding LacI/PurR family transcriptional regulator
MSTTDSLRRQPKLMNVCEQLTGIAQELGGGAKMPTVTQLCDSLTVSRGTLHKALGELERQKIVSRVHGNGIFVSSRLGLKTIGFVHAMSESMSSPFWDLLLSGAQERASAGHEQFNFYLGARGTNGHNLPIELMNAERAGRLQGLIFIGQPSDEALQWVSDHNMPMVGFANSRMRYRVQPVSELVPSLGVDYLARTGCRRLGLWRPFGLWQRSEGYDPSIIDYPALFQAGLRDHELPSDPTYSWRQREKEAQWVDGVLEDKCPAELESLQEQGYRAVREVLGALERSQWPDGLILTNDVFARGVLVGLQRLGVQIGEDIHVVSHANAGSTMLLGYEDQIAVAEFDPAAITSELFSLLETLMSGREPSVPIRLIEPTLIEPATVAFAF